MVVDVRSEVRGKENKGSEGRFHHKVVYDKFKSHL